MALTYRTPMEDIVASFEPALQASISSKAALAYKQMEEENFSIANYYMCANAKRKLSEAGIYLSPFSAVVHSHPICKTLENYLLFKVLPSYIDCRFFFVGIKMSKVQMLKQRDPTLSLITALNRYVTSKDKARYGNDFVIRSTGAHPQIQRHQSTLAELPFKDLVPELKMRNGTRLFLHDELHYWRKKDLCIFLEALDPEILIGTLVFPPELLIGAKKSLNPWCYDFEIRGNILLYYPDGVRSEGYEQPLHGGYLLKTSEIRLHNGITYQVDILCSKFSHHLVCLTRGNLLTQKYRAFDGFDAVGFESLRDLTTGRLPYLPICFDVVSRIYRYLKSLKKPDSQSAMAKLSQIVADPSADEIKFVQEFSDLVINSGVVRSVLCVDRWKHFLCKFYKGVLPGWLAERFSVVRDVSLDEFVSNLRPLSIVKKTEVLEQGCAEEAFDWDGLFADADVDVVAKLDEFYSGIANGVGPHSLTSRPYVGTPALSARLQGQRLLELDPHIALQVCCKLYFKYNLTQIQHELHELEVIEFIGIFFSRNAMISPKNILSMRFGTVHIVQRIISRVRSLSARNIFTTFRLGAFEWFTSCRRHYTKFICATPDHTKTFKSLSASWGNVLSEFRSGTVKGWLHEEHCGGSDKSCIIADADECVRHTDSHESLGAHLKNFEGPRETLVEPIVLFCQEACTDILPGRRAAFFSNYSASYNYNGGRHVARKIPDWLADLRNFCGLDDEYDHILIQVYEAGAGIGFHADDEDCYLEGVTVATLNVTGRCVFKVRPTIAGKSEFPLSEMQMLIMPAGFQSTGKHSVKVIDAGRISVTFRNCTKDYHSRGKAIQTFEQERTPNRFEDSDANETDEGSGEDVSRFGISTAGKATIGFSKSSMEEIQVIRDYESLWAALADLLEVRYDHILQCGQGQEVQASFDFLGEMADYPLNEAEINSLRALACLCVMFDMVVLLHLDDFRGKAVITVHGEKKKQSKVYAQYKLDELALGAPCSKILPANLCVIKAIAESLGRDTCDLLLVLERGDYSELLQQIYRGQGVELLIIEHLCSIFSICASIDTPEGVIEFNKEGTNMGFFRLEQSHLTFVQRKKDAGFDCSKVINLDLQFLEQTLNLLRAQGTTVSYKVDFSRAGLLADCFQSGNTGVILSEIFNGQPNMRELFYCKKAGSKVGEGQGDTWPITCIIGTFGSGKSRMFRRIGARAMGRRFSYVTPRKALLDSIMDDMQVSRKRNERKRRGQENWHFSTFEKFLKEVPFLAQGQLVFIDEMQLYPPGYIDLVLAMSTPGVHFVLLGDPCQSDYDSEKDRSLLEGLPSIPESVLGKNTYKFNLMSHRFINKNFIGRLPCLMNESGFVIDEPYTIREGLEFIEEQEEVYKKVILVSSFDEKKIVKSYSKGDPLVLTFGESTGLTFDYGCIVVTLISQRANERRWLTALSRFRKNISIINCTGYSLDSLMLQYQGRFLNKFMSGTATTADLGALLPGSPEFSGRFTELIGRDEGVREEKLVGDPWLKCMIDLFQIEDVQEEEMQASVQAIEEFKIHLPREELEGTRARWVHKILAREFRETRMGHLTSEQFTDDYSKQRGGLQLTNAAERFETIYPRHRANDTVTFIMALKKRLRFSKPQKEMAKLKKALPYGKFLLQEFLKHVPLKSYHDYVKMEKARQDFFDKKTSKSAATIENHNIRSCRDWLADVGQIFSKSQLCTKFDNRFRSAKAAQSIVCFQHSVLCRFAPYMRYIEMKLHEALPDRFYIHSGKGLDQLNDWVVRSRFDGVCTESDYEAFDSSQDEYIMAFELELMKYLRMPWDLIKDYEYIKTHLGSKLGNFAIMRFSGEASTFLFNTMANMLFTFLRYNLKGHESICFAGDDMCSSKRLTKKTEHEDFLSKLTLKAKVQHTDHPTFCGWHLCVDGIYKKPQLVLERMCIALETNNLHNCIDNYAIEVSYAYRLGERITARMNEEEIGAYYGCVRMIVRHKHLLKSDVKDLFANVF
ncbi:MAG: RNA-dependent RNA polymerase [Hainan betaflexivirus]|nr:MAG: RNA-dependent RNA polymerase [Hainan betaflexivirus]